MRRVVLPMLVALILPVMIAAACVTNVCEQLLDALTGRRS